MFSLTIKNAIKIKGYLLQLTPNEIDGPNATYFVNSVYKASTQMKTVGGFNFTQKVSFSKQVCYKMENVVAFEKSSNAITKCVVFVEQMIK